MRCNELIRISPVRLIDQDKNMIGVISTAEAIQMARDAGMDLVEVSPNERPPVCRIMDYGKHKYNLSKKQKQKHHEHKMKEVRLRPKTDQHDRDIKMNRARGFLEQGDRVQFTMLFRGRERFHHGLGVEAMKTIAEKLADISKIDRPVKSMGRRMTMVLAPLKLPSSGKSKQKPQTAGKKEKPKQKAQPAGVLSSQTNKKDDSPSTPDLNNSSAVPSNNPSPEPS